MIEDFGIKFGEDFGRGQQVANAGYALRLTRKARQSGDDGVLGGNHAMQNVEQPLVVGGFEHVVCSQQRRGVFIGGLFQSPLEIGLEVDGYGFERDRFGHGETPGKLLAAQN